MRILVFLATALLLAAPALAQRRPPPPPPAPLTPALWEVRQGNASMLLFGTVHALPRGVDWFRPHVADALDSADRLVMETLPPESPGSMLPVVMRLARLPQARPLMQRVPESHRPLLAAAIERLKPPAMEWYETWYVALTLANLQAAANGIDPRVGAEAVLAERARMRGKPMAALETAEEQLIYFDALTEADQQLLLMATLEDLAEARARLNAIIAAWMTGDTAALAASINRDKQRSPMLMRMLVNDRNARWADWIARQLQAPGRTFLAVGAGHLAGPGSLQEELERRGLTVTRVEPAPPPRPRRR